MNDSLEQDLAAMRLAEPSAELDDRVAMLLTVEHPLSTMTLCEPSAGLDERMAKVFADDDAPAAGPYRFALLRRIALPLAACLAIGLTVFFMTRPDNTPNPSGPGLATVTPPVEIQPVRFDETVVSDEAGDVIILDDQLPVVPIRRQAIQTTRWVDEANNVEIEMTVPHEQTLIVPVQVD